MPYPYQVRLMDGQFIYALQDNEASITLVPRFEVGAYVKCNVGNEEYAVGRVVAHHYEGPGRTVYPYQIKLQDGGLIFASADDDFCVTTYVAPSWAMTMKNHPSCSCSCSLHGGRRTLLKSILASWKCICSVDCPAARHNPVSRVLLSGGQVNPTPALAA